MCAQNPPVSVQKCGTQTLVSVSVNTKNANVGTNGMQTSAAVSARRNPAQLGADSTMSLVHVRQCAHTPKRMTVMNTLTLITTLASANAAAPVRKMRLLMKTVSAGREAVMCVPICTGGQYATSHNSTMECPAGMLGTIISQCSTH